MIPRCNLCRGIGWVQWMGMEWPNCSTVRLLLPCDFCNLKRLKPVPK